MANGAADYGGGMAVMLVAEARAPDRLAAAIEALGGRIIARAGWADSLPDPAIVQVVAVEAAGVTDDTLVHALPAIVARAESLGAGLVVAMEAGQIDVIAATALGKDRILLADPDIAACAGAIAVAAERARLPDGVFDIGRETDTARFDRLNAEVARIAETLARLTRHDIERDSPPIVGDRTSRYGAQPPSVTAADVRRAIRTRRLREQFFGPGYFEDPGWDMLLDLFAAELEHRRVSVSSLCIAAAVAPTTALRWIGRMSDAGLFERQPDTLDRRRAFMALSSRAGEAMRGYMAAARRAELGIA